MTCPPPGSHGIQLTPNYNDLGAIESWDVDPFGEHDGLCSVAFTYEGTADPPVSWCVTGACPGKCSGPHHCDVNQPGSSPPILQHRYVWCSCPI